MRGFSVCISSLLFVLCLLTFRGAEASPSQQEQQLIIRQQQQLLRQDEERRQEEERQRKLRELAPPKPKEEKPEPPSSNGKKCIKLDKISLSRNSILTAKDAQNLVKRFLGRCIGTNEFQVLLKSINDAFRDRGYITTRAYIRPQNISDGSLEITVIEGTIEKLALNKDTLADQSQVFFAFPTSAGDVLNIRDVEQGLDQMNRLASNNAKMQIAPGQTTGSSVVKISNAPTDPIRLSFGRDNSGTSSTGKLQNIASLNVDNMMRMNDAWALNYSRTARDFGSSRRSESLSGTYSIPFGYSTLSYSGSYYTYSTLVEGNVQDFLTSGTSTSHKAEFSNVIHRDQNSKTRFDLSITAKNAHNYIEDVLVDASSRRLSVGRLALAHSTRALGGVASVELGFEHGLRLLGALKDAPDQPSDQPKAQFRKWTLESNFQRPFTLASQKFSWTSSTSWQYAPDTLFGTERIGVGGQYSVRGFRDDTLAGDTGGYWRNEIGWSPDTALLGPVGKLVRYVQPYAAYDWGWVKKDPKETRERGTLSGVALGLRSAGKHFSLSVEWAHALHSPSFLEKNGQEINFRAVFQL